MASVEMEGKRLKKRKKKVADEGEVEKRRKKDGLDKGEGEGRKAEIEEDLEKKRKKKKEKLDKKREKLDKKREKLDKKKKEEVAAFSRAPFKERIILINSQTGNPISSDNQTETQLVMKDGAEKRIIQFNDHTFQTSAKKRKNKKEKEVVPPKPEISNNSQVGLPNAACPDHSTCAETSVFPENTASPNDTAFPENTASSEITASQTFTDGEDVVRKKIKKAKRRSSGVQAYFQEDNEASESGGLQKSVESGRVSGSQESVESGIYSGLQRSIGSGGVGGSQRSDRGESQIDESQNRGESVDYDNGITLNDSTSALNDSPLNDSAQLEEDRIYLDHWAAAKGKPDTKYRAYLADARVKLSEHPQTQEIVTLNVSPGVLKDMRNADFDYPITTAVWARHNSGRASALINRLNDAHRHGQLMTRAEADEVADFFLQNKESVEGHALQFSRTVRSKYSFTNQQIVRLAFAAKGISLRNDRFSPREDKILTQNFEVFLATRGIASTDKEKIHEMLFSPEEREFRQSSGLLIFLGHRLIRSSDSVYIAVRRLYHKYSHKGYYNAEETQKMIDYYEDLKRRNFNVTHGHNGDHKASEEVILRPCRSIYGKYQHLKKKDSVEKDVERSDLKLLAEIIRRMTGVSELSQLRDPVPWDRVAEEVKGRESLSALHSLSVPGFERLWILNWRRRCLIYEKPKWTWKDFEKLVEEVGRQQAEEGCVDEKELDWDAILKLFPQALDVKHIRSRWLRLRNQTPFFMLKHLCGIVKFLKTDLLPKKLGRGGGGGGGGGGDGGGGGGVHDVLDGADDSSTEGE